MRLSIFVFALVAFVVAKYDSLCGQQVKPHDATPTTLESKQILIYSYSHYPAEMFTTNVEVSEAGVFSVSERNGSPKVVNGSRPLGKSELVELQQLLQAVESLPAKAPDSVPDGPELSIRTQNQERRFGGQDLELPAIRNLTTWIRKQIDQSK